MPYRDDEIVSYNRELLTFDIDNLTIEELERRLELAVGALPLEASGSCESFNAPCTIFDSTCSGF